MAAVVDVAAIVVDVGVVDLSLETKEGPYDANCPA